MIDIGIRSRLIAKLRGCVTNQDYHLAAAQPRSTQSRPLPPVLPAKAVSDAIIKAPGRIEAIDAKLDIGAYEYASTPSVPLAISTRRTVTVNVVTYKKTW